MIGEPLPSLKQTLHGAIFQVKRKETPRKLTGIHHGMMKMIPHQISLQGDTLCHKGLIHYQDTKPKTHKGKKTILVSKTVLILIWVALTVTCLIMF